MNKTKYIYNTLFNSIFHAFSFTLWEKSTESSKNNYIGIVFSQLGIITSNDVRNSIHFCSLDHGNAIILFAFKWMNHQCYLFSTAHTIHTQFYHTFIIRGNQMKYLFYPHSEIFTIVGIPARDEHIWLVATFVVIFCSRCWHDSIHTLIMRAHFQRCYYINKSRICW